MQRGREEVRVYLRLPEEQRNSITDIESSLVRTASGAEVPVSRVASLSSGMSPPAIHRQDGQRIVRVTADVDPAVISGGRANRILEDDILAALVAEDPELTYTFGGEPQQQLESLNALGTRLRDRHDHDLRAARDSAALVYQAVHHHGYHPVRVDRGDSGPLGSGRRTQLPVLYRGIRLAGVVVNDSLVMIDFIDQELDEGLPPREAIIEGAKGRFRPIMLTSLTTFLGFMPLILEDAIQAQFFVPFSASVGCGIPLHYGHPDVPRAGADLDPPALACVAGARPLGHGHLDARPGFGVGVAHEIVRGRPLAASLGCALLYRGSSYEWEGRRENR